LSATNSLRNPTHWRRPSVCKWKEFFNQVEERIVVEKRTGKEIIGSISKI